VAIGDLVIPFESVWDSFCWLQTLRERNEASNSFCILAERERMVWIRCLNNSWCWIEWRRAARLGK
jgi:hypothetical protein